MPIPAFLAPLIQGGLTLLANGVMAKGKEWVQEKTGIDLAAASLTPDQMVQLKQLEIDHEEELIRLRQVDDRLSLEFFQEEVKDKDSARKRDAEFLRAGMRNYRADSMYVVAVVVVLLLVYLVWKQTDAGEFTKGVITLVLGRFLGYLDNLYNYEFGTTRGSRSKDTTIEHLSKGGQP